MSIWEYNTAIGGYLRAHALEGEQGMTSDQEASLSDLLKEAQHVR